VIATASVRDRYSGREAARFFSLLVLISGVAPIVAPIVGGELLRFTSWRGIFMILAAIGLLLTVAVATNLAESLPHGEAASGRPEGRHRLPLSAGPGAALHGLRGADGNRLRRLLRLSRQLLVRDPGGLTAPARSGSA